MPKKVLLLDAGTYIRDFVSISMRHHGYVKTHRSMRDWNLVVLIVPANSNLSSFLKEMKVSDLSIKPQTGLIISASLTDESLVKRLTWVYMTVPSGFTVNTLDAGINQFFTTHK